VLLKRNFDAFVLVTLIYLNLRKTNRELIKTCNSLVLLLSCDEYPWLGTYATYFLLLSVLVHFKRVFLSGYYQ